MDFRKVIDQTVRELKREVNKTILKVPEIEQKVLDATSNEPWGPHGTLMSEIAQATRNYYELQMILAILWKRLSDTGHNWRHVYKALTVLEYLVAHGSERGIDDMKEHVYQITTLADFQFVEPNGKDQGINVRKKSQSLVILLNDKEKISEVRQKAAENRDKYGGVSSSGAMSKFSSYKSTGGSYADDRYKEESYSRHGVDKYHRERDVDKHGDDDWNGRDNDLSSQHRDQYRRYHKDFDEDADTCSSQKGNDGDRQSSRDSKPFAGHPVSAKSANTPENNESDDFDDFNPRAVSAASTSQLGNLFDQPESSGAVRPSPPPAVVSSSFWGDASNLFGDGDSSNVTPAPPPQSLQNLGEDLFGNSPSVESSGSPSLTAVKVAIKPPPSYIPTGNGMKASFLPSSKTKPASGTLPPMSPVGNVAGSVDFATFDALTSSASSENQPASVGVDFFGLYTSSTSDAFTGGASQSALPLNVPAPAPSALSGAFHTSQQFSMPSSSPSQPLVGVASQGQSNIKPKQANQFETKSTIWADSLSKGLIDLNITAPKSNTLADIGVDFDQLRTERVKDDRLLTGKSTAGMGKAMGSGSGLGVAGASAVVPPAMPMTMNNTRMASPMGMGMGMGMMNLGMGAGMRPMMQTGLNPGVAVQSGVGMGIGMGKNYSSGGLSNQQQHYGGTR